jgi:hypothetical protein
MLKNWPRPGTTVKFVQDVQLTSGRVIPAGTQATLSGDVVRKLSEDSDDTFEVTLSDGTRITNIYRRQIE